MIFALRYQRSGVGSGRLFACLLLFCGCSRSVPAARLEGRVTHNGQPVSEGGVSVTPLAGGKSVSTDLVNGHYVADGIQRGQVRVRVTAFRKTGRTSTLDGVQTPELASIVPERLRDGVVIEVIEDRLNYDLNLDP